MKYAKSILAAIVAFCAAVANAEVDAGEVEAALREVRSNPKSPAVSTVLAAARAENADEELTSNYMGVYTLAMGAQGNDAVCKSAWRSLSTRHPKSKAVEFIKKLDIFPAPCYQCKGTGKVQGKEYNTCRICKGTGNCSKCNGAGEVEAKQVGLRSGVRVGGWAGTEARKMARCTTCNGTGRCTACSNGRLIRTADQECPYCHGEEPAIDRQKAVIGLDKFCGDLLNKNDDARKAEEALAQALNANSPDGKIAALKKHLAEYSTAATSAEAKRLLDETIAQKKAQEEEERKAAAKIRDDHLKTLRNIKNMEPSPEAITALHEFLEKNPDSPVAEEFRLAEPEIIAEIVKKREAEKHKKYLRIGIGSAVGIAFLLWCIAFARLNIFVKVVRRGGDDL